MILELRRRWKKADYTIGNLFVNGEYFCDTLEDADRGLSDEMGEREIRERKVYGKTAIPAGTYTVNMTTRSPKFAYRSWAKPYGGVLPRLLNVKGFDGVLIHVGNSANDTLGCILVGKNKVKGQVTESTVAFKRLMDAYLLPAHKKGEIIIIDIE